MGAPWVKPEAVAREAATPGFTLEPDRLHARGLGGGAAAEAPRGSLPWRSRAGDATPRAARPLALGLRLLIALRRHSEFAWVREGAGLDTLTGTKAVRAALERGDGVETILAAEEPAIERWRREREASLLY